MSKPILTRCRRVRLLIFSSVVTWLMIFSGGIPNPSSALIAALQSLAAAVQQLGTLSDPVISNDRARSLLCAFADTFTEKLNDEPIPPGNAAQVVCDLTLLHAILDSWGPVVEKTSSRVLAAAQRPEVRALIQPANTSY